MNASFSTFTYLPESHECTSACFGFFYLNNGLYWKHSDGTVFSDAFFMESLLWPESFLIKLCNWSTDVGREPLAGFKRVNC